MWGLLTCAVHLPEPVHPGNRQGPPLAIGRRGRHGSGGLWGHLFSWQLVAMSTLLQFEGTGEPVLSQAQW